MPAFSLASHLHYLWLVPLGLAVGAVGTLIGAGGGFILAPVLLLLFPDEGSLVISTISLAVVFLNALSGSIAYARLRRIHYPSGLIFAAASVPGAILGATLVKLVPREVFARVLGTLLTAMAAYLLLHRHAEGPEEKHAAGPEGGAEPHVHEARAAPAGPDPGKAGPLTGGPTHPLPLVPPYSRILACAISFVVGVASSLLGIGGGIIHVPFMVKVLKFRTHVATATSHFVLAIMAGAGTAVHVVEGDFHTGAFRTLFLGAGVLAGAQAGAALSTRLHGKWIIRCLAVALIFVGVRTLFA